MHFTNKMMARTVLLSVIGIVALGGIGIAGFTLYEKYAGPEVTVETEAETEEADVARVEDVLVAVGEETEVTEEAETELETEMETETETGPILVKLVGSSIEKDLKIKIQDEEQNNVKGEEFFITVTPDEKNAQGSLYNDHDNDGIVYIKDIEGGDYIVVLSEIDGYYTEEKSIKVTVKEKIEYVEVEIKDEIKTEEEVAPSEDAEKTNDVVVEAVIQDTVPLLETGCVPTAVDATALSLDRYITSKASSGTSVTKTLPEGEPIAFRRSSRVVGSEQTDLLTAEETIITCIITHSFNDGRTAETQEVSGVAGTVVEINAYEGYTTNYAGGTSYTIKEGETAITIEWEKVVETPVEIVCTITHTFNDGRATETQQVSGVTGTVVGINSYEGYTTNYAAGSSYTIKEGETTFTIEWEKVVTTPAEIVCTITHVFDDGKVSETQEVRGTAGTVVDGINVYEGYTTSYAGGSSYTIKEGETTFTINWSKIASTPTATAKISMPSTATMFVSKLDVANKLTLAVAIEDNNKTKLVDASNITWSLKDDNVGGVALSATTGESVVISTTMGTSKAGTVTVVASVPYTYNNEKKNAELVCVVTVQTDAYDGTKILMDATNTALYKDTNCTQLASVADLVENGITTFYKDPKYTGWQTLGGKLYYYNANNQPVTGTQIISGITYVFGPDGALSEGATSTGIDVSKWQGNIDWNAVKSAGIEFAIIRVGYRGSETGVLVEDPYYRQNINGATAAGLKVGVYFFTQAITEAEAVEEASMALSLTQGYNLAYPIFVDTENGSGNARANGLDKATRTACVAAFCKTIQNGGRTAGVYASKSWYYNKLNTNQLNSYCIWVAQYSTECNYTGTYSIWQYSSTGKIPGIKGNVDLNISYM